MDSTRPRAKFTGRGLGRMRTAFAPPLLAALALVCVGCCAILVVRPIIEAWVTAEAVQALTHMYGQEVSEAVERYETGWNGLEANRDPRLRAEYATGPFLDYWSKRDLDPAGGNADGYIVMTAVSVTKLRVLEYSPRRFKTVVCVSGLGQTISTAGVSLDKPEPFGYRGVYVFVREDGQWKAAGFFNNSIWADIDRDWYLSPQWLKEIIGSVPRDPDPVCQ